MARFDTFLAKAQYLERYLTLPAAANGSKSPSMPIRSTCTCC